MVKDSGSGAGRGKSSRGLALVVVREILGQDTMQVGLVEHDHLIQTIAAYRTDDSFAIWILPRRVRSKRDFLNAQVLDPLLEVVAIGTVAIP